MSRLVNSSVADSAQVEKSTAGIVIEQVPVSRVQKGDILVTLDPISKVETTVLVTSNERIRQRLLFTTLKLQSGKHLTVTSDHGVIVNRGASGDVLVPASNVMLGDALYQSNGELQYVQEMQTAELEVRYTLQTATGTVLAADMFVGTLCGFELSHSLTAKLAMWSAAHVNGKALPRTLQAQP